MLTIEFKRTNDVIEDGSFDKIFPESVDVSYAVKYAKVITYRRAIIKTPDYKLIKVKDFTAELKRAREIFKHLDTTYGGMFEFHTGDL